MKKWLVIVVSIILAVALVSMSVGCKKKAATAPVVDTPTTVPTAVPTVIDNFEDANDFSTAGLIYKNLLDGSWVASLDAFGSNLTVTADNSGGQTGNYSIKMSGGLKCTSSPSQWAWLSFAGDMNASATAVDFNALTIAGYVGIKVKTKTTLGTGTGSNTAFIIQWPSTAQTNDVKYRYLITPSSTWTTLTIPFSSFTVAGWAQGGADDKPRATYYAGIRAIEFSIAALQQDINTSGTEWYIDDIQFY